MTAPLTAWRVLGHDGAAAPSRVGSRQTALTHLTHYRATMRAMAELAVAHRDLRAWRRARWVTTESLIVAPWFGLAAWVTATPALLLGTVAMAALAWVTARRTDVSRVTGAELAYQARLARLRLDQVLGRAGA